MINLGDILEHVMGFISDNMENAKWQKRAAAIMAFGSVLEGPPPEKLKPYIDTAMLSLEIHCAGSNDTQSCFEIVLVKECGMSSPF